MKLLRTGCLSLVMLSPSMAPAVTVDWQSARSSTYLRNVVEYRGYPLLTDGVYYHTSEREFGSTDTAPIDTNRSLFFQQSQDIWGGAIANRVGISYQIQPNGSGTAAFVQETSARSQFFPHPTATEPERGQSTLSWGDIGRRGFPPDLTSLSLTFALTEPAELKVTSVSRIQPATPREPDGSVPHTSSLNAAGTCCYSDSGDVFTLVQGSGGGPNFNVLLSPGVHTVSFLVTGTAAHALAFPEGPSVQIHSTRSQYSVSWAFAGEAFPGETPDNPILAYAAEEIQPSDGEDEPPPATDPIDIAGTNLKVALQGGLGHTRNAYFALPTRVNGGGSKGALITGYQLTSEHSPITSFTVPDLLPGAEGLSIDFGADMQSVTPGQSIDFGATGVQSFTLAGFDPEHASNELDAFVMGLQFAEEGLASLSAVPILYNPPGDYDKNGFVNGGDFLVWQQQLGSPQEMGAEADGTGDGFVDAHDLALWRERFGAPIATTAASGLVPEPSPLTLGGAALLALHRRQRRAQRTTTLDRRQGLRPGPATGEKISCGVKHSASACYERASTQYEVRRTA